jgi:FKBP-type peptidyl-prolyl cis-trans isomerase
MWIAFRVAVFVLLMPYSSELHAQAPPAGDASAAAKQTRTASGLVYETVVKGTGPMAQRGDKLRIHETLSLPDGKVIFNSREKNQTVTFVLGANQVIPGVDEGVTGMRVGERRKLLVPPSLDGRTFDPAFIPPDAIRHYDIELIEIVKEPGGYARSGCAPCAILLDCLGKRALFS